MKAKPTGSHYREMADFRALKTSKQRSGHPEFRVLQDSWCEEHCSQVGGHDTSEKRYYRVLQCNILTGYPLFYNK